MHVACLVEVLRSPAGDGVSNVLIHTDEYGERHQYGDRVARTEAVREVIILGATGVGRPRDQSNQLVHSGDVGIQVLRESSLESYSVFCTNFQRQ